MIDEKRKKNNQKRTQHKTSTSTVFCSNTHLYNGGAFDLGRVGQHSVEGGHNHRRGKRGLEVRLVPAGQNATSMIHLLTEHQMKRTKHKEETIKKTRSFLFFLFLYLTLSADAFSLSSHVAVLINSGGIERDVAAVLDRQCSCCPSKNCFVKTYLKLASFWNQRELFDFFSAVLARVNTQLFRV
jgi:hypothetical protein